MLLNRLKSDGLRIGLTASLLLILTVSVYLFRPSRYDVVITADRGEEVATAPLPGVSSSDDNNIMLVVASMQHENTSWLGQYFPSWLKSIYIVDDPDAALTVPRNKGRESMVYLSYIIDNYHHLPENNIFIHAQRFQWHNDDPDYDGLPLLRSLQWAYLQAEGYVNLRCVWVIGCPNEIHPFAVEPNKGKEDKPTTEEIFKVAFQELFPDQEVPQAVAASCCAQFAVTRSKIHERPREDYVRMREWLLSSELDDSLTGRVFEYSWHIIFGKDAVHCPHAGDCYCQVFGMCDLSCSEDKCGGRYILPPYATLPNGWPRIGWSGEMRDFTGPL